MDIILYLLTAFGVLALIIVGIVVLTNRINDTPVAKARKAFVKTMKNLKFSRKDILTHVVKYARGKSADEEKATYERVIKMFKGNGDFLKSIPTENPLEIATNIATAKNSDGHFVLTNDEFDKFFYCFRLIRAADTFFDEKNMIKVYRVCKTEKKDVLEKFARAWVDQMNADLRIDLDTALEFVSKDRDFPLFVNLDIMAKRAEIEIDEKNMINDVDDNGLKIIIYALIRAKYEGIYMSEEESCQINKANVLEYNDTFKITEDLLKQLYSLSRDVNGFTNTMIRAHNAGIKINFSMSDLLSLGDEDFDNLVNNIIKASDKGISIDQKDLIRQNIQGNSITELVRALIKANEYKLDLTPDELMNYMVHTKCDVVKFVKAYNFALRHRLPSEDGTPLSKDHLVEYSREGVDLYDYVQGLQIARDIEEGALPYDGLGITYDNLKEHFKAFGSVMDTISAVITAKNKGLALSFGLASAIYGSEKYTLGSAMAWAQRPQVKEVEPSPTCICKNGVQITPKISITIRGKLPLIFSGYDLDILFKRINEAVVMELESAENHEKILKTLPEISQNVLNRINEENNKEIKTAQVNEAALNKVSRYELLDVNIHDVTIGNNVKSELELRQAQIESEIRRLKAEADRAKAEADIRIAMVEQYKDGVRPNFNELHKANLLAEKSDDITTGYEK